MTLKTICLRAIEKRPANRYNSATSFREDLERFLDRKPVVARPIGNLERGVKWSRRHPYTAFALAAALIATTILLTMWGVFTWQIRQQRDHIRQTASQLKLEREQALANFDRAFEAVHQYMHSVHNNPQLGNERLIELRKELLQHGTEFYEDMIRDNEAVAVLPAARLTTEKVRLEQARLFFTVGKLQYITEDFFKAKQSFERALQICTDILGDELIASRKVDAGLPGAVLVSLARTNIYLDDFETAIGQADRAREYFHSVSDLDQLSYDYQRWYLCDTFLAKVLAFVGTGDRDNALLELETGIDVARELPAIPDFYLPLAKMLLERIRIYMQLENVTRYTEDLLELETIIDKLTEAAPDSLRYMSVRAEYYAALSKKLEKDEDWNVASEALHKAVQLQERLFLSRPYKRIEKRLAELKWLNIELLKKESPSR